MISGGITGRGIFEALDKVEKLAAILNGETDEISSILEDLANEAREIAADNTHEATGTLKHSHTVTKRSPQEFAIHSDPAAINPIAQVAATQYALEEHDRGGDHAFYEIVEQSFGESLLSEAANDLYTSLENA